MSSLVSTGDVRALVHTGMIDGDLQSLIGRVEADVTDKVGAPYSSTLALTETISGGCEDLFLKRRISSVTSVTEYAELTSATGTVLVEGTTFHVWAGQGRLVRLGGVLFGARVAVVYSPRDERDRRRQVIIDLIRLEIARTALASERVANEYEYEALDNYEAERRRIMRRLTLTKV